MLSLAARMFTDLATGMSGPLLGNRPVVPPSRLRVRGEQSLTSGAGFGRPMRPVAEIDGRQGCVGRAPGDLHRETDMGRDRRVM